MRPVLAYTGKRLLFLPVAIFLVVTFSFALVNLAPGDPALVIAGGLASEEQIQEIRVELGLAQSLPERYVTYMRGLLQGDLGTSFYSKRPVMDEIVQRLPNSLELVAMSLAAAVLYGVFIGGVAAYFRSRPHERVARVMIGASQSLPDFFLGLVLIYVLFYLLGWAPPPVGRLGLTDTPPPAVTGGVMTDALLAGQFDTFITALHHSMLPVLALGIFYSAYIAKTTRAALSTAFSSRQVEFARACGLPEWKVIGYALRQARTPIITYIAILFAVLVGGAAIVETVFAWGGVGQWAIERILALDIPAIQGFILLTGLTTLLTYVFLDLVVAALDPRISYTNTER